MLTFTIDEEVIFPGNPESVAFLVHRGATEQDTPHCWLDEPGFETEEAVRSFREACTLALEASGVVELGVAGTTQEVLFSPLQCKQILEQMKEHCELHDQYCVCHPGIDVLRDFAAGDRHMKVICSTESLQAA